MGKPKDENTDMSEQHNAARRDMRGRLLKLGDDALKHQYYTTITLAEHEAMRRGKKQTDTYGLALMMIREGGSPPGQIAAEALAKYTR